MRRLEGPEHLAKIRTQQYALVNHLQEPSTYAEVDHAAKHGPVPSKSAIYMLHLIDDAWRRLEADLS